MKLSSTRLIVLLALVLPFQAAAQNGQLDPGFHAECRIQAANGRGKVLLLVSNDVGRGITLSGVTSSPLMTAASGTAGMIVNSMPSFRRQLSPGNHLTFQWAVRFTGCGTIAVTNEVTAENPDGITLSTGEVSCGAVLVDGLECRPKTPTRTARVTFTPKPTRTARVTFTPKPTRTQSTLPPTRTRPPTFTPKPTRTPRTPPPTRTRRALPATRTPFPTFTARPTRTPRDPLATRTPSPTVVIVSQGFTAECSVNETHGNGKVMILVTNRTGAGLADVAVSPLTVQTNGVSVNVKTTPRSRRKLTNGNHVTFQIAMSMDGCGTVAIADEVSARAPDGSILVMPVQCPLIELICRESTATWTPRKRPTPPSTRTPFPTFTSRPTKTRQPSTTPTATPEIFAGRIQTNCFLQQRGDTVRVFLNVVNETNGLVTDFAGGALVAEVLDGAPNFENLSGPSPRVYSRVQNGSSISFQWTGRFLDPGTVAFTVSAQGKAQNAAPVDTGPVACGTATVDPLPPSPFDPLGFIGRCSIVPAHGFVVSVEFTLTNDTGGTLSDVVVAPIELTPTGTVAVGNVAGPHPAALRKLPDHRRARIRWRAEPSGLGQLFTHVSASAIGPNGEAVTTGRIECNALNVPPRIIK